MGKSNQGKQRKPTAFPLSQSMARVWFQIIRLGCSAEIYSAPAPETPAPLAVTIFLVQWDKEMKELRSLCAKPQKWSPLPGGFPGNIGQDSGVSPLPYKGTKITWIVYCSSVALNAGIVLAGHKRGLQAFLSEPQKLCADPGQGSHRRKMLGWKYGFRGLRVFSGTSLLPGNACRLRWPLSHKKNPHKMPKLFFCGKAALTAGSQQTLFI